MQTLHIRDIAALTDQVAQTVESVLNSTFNESRVFEFKSLYKDDAPAMKRHAQQLCGLCNAAAGDVVFYVFGVDAAARTLTPTAVAENWWPQLQKRFVERPPHLVWSDSVSVASGLVHAFAFETTRAPFAVKSDVSIYKEKSDDPHAAFEYHWRENTHRRSARPSDLRRILVGTPSAPRSEVLAIRGPAVTAPVAPAEGRTAHIVFTLQIDELYIAPPSADAVVELPFYMMSASLKVDGSADGFPLTQLNVLGFEGQRVSMRIERPEVLSLDVRGEFRSSAMADQLSVANFVEVDLRFGAEWAVPPIALTIRLERTRESRRSDTFPAFRWDGVSGR